MAKKDEKPGRHWEEPLSHKIRHTILTVAITLVVVGGGAGAYLFFTQDTQSSIVASPKATTVKSVAVPNDTHAAFTEANFSFTLPQDWKKTGEVTTGPYHKYSYQATLKNNDNRYLDIYQDSLPLNMPVNLEVAVRSEGDHLSHGMVSDNCTNFTTKESPHALTAQAKWDGVDFICDMDNTGENIVGTSAPGSINKVELTNVGFTKHSFFFVYTDHNYNPDYNIFYSMLDSFTVK